jgi:HEAT repeat protein
VDESAPATTPNAVAYDLPRLVADLKSNTPGRREKAIEMAPVLDGQGLDVIPTLLEALNDPSAADGGTYGDRPTSSREGAVLALLSLKEKGKSALLGTGLTALQQGLKDPKPNVKEHTANAIGLIGPEAAPAASALVGLCSDKDRDVRSAAYRALERIKNVPSARVLSLLVHADVAVASDAAAALAWLKPTGAESVPLLLAGLQRVPKDGDDAGDVAFIRNAAAEALAGVGKPAEPAIPALVDLLTKATVADVERFLRPNRPGQIASDVSGPVLALRRLGKPAADAVVPLLKHDQPIVRYQAAAVLGGMGRDGTAALPAVESALASERALPSGQLYVFEELAATATNLGGDPAKVTDAIVDVLTIDDEGVKTRAAGMLARVGRQAAPAVPKLVELLGDKSLDVRVAAAEALAAVGAAAEQAVPVLAKAVEGEDVTLARAATGALKALGTASAPAAPALAKALSSNDQNFCIEAADALAAIGPAAAPAVPTLAKQLGDSQVRPEERAALLRAVAAIGKNANGAVPAVTRLLGDKDSTTRAAAAETLGKIGVADSDTTKLLVARLSDSHSAVRVASLKALAATGAKSAEPDVQAFRERTTDPAMKVWASATLVGLGSADAGDLKVVVDALRDKSPTAKGPRLAAIESAQVLGPKAKAVVPELLIALKDKSPIGRKDGEQVRERAARTLGRLGDKAAVPALTELLRDADRRARRAAAEALGAIGPDAVVAVARLRDLARDDPAVADVAQAALDRIEPPKKAKE